MSQHQKAQVASREPVSLHEDLKESLPDSQRRLVGSKLRRLAPKVTGRRSHPQMVDSFALSSIGMISTSARLKTEGRSA